MFSTFSILSKIITVSENTLMYRKRLRTIYRDYLNEQRTVKYIQYGRLKCVFHIESTQFLFLFIFSYGSMNKSLVQYTNGNQLKNSYYTPYQQQFLTSYNLLHRPQTQRTNHQR